MLSRYTKHHNLPIHVFIYTEDAHHVCNLDELVPILSDSEESLVKKSALCGAHKEGNKGTALLWGRIIEMNNGALLIHLDADNIFLGEVVNELLSGLNRGGITGIRRPYRRTTSRKGLGKLQLFFRPDAVNTHDFGFRKDLKGLTRAKSLNHMLARRLSLFQSLFCPVIDFFDPITLYIRRNMEIYYLDSKDQAKSGDYSRYGDFEKKIISFAAVGSGYPFFQGNSKASSLSYKEFAISSYSLYSKYLLGREINVAPLNSDYIENRLKRLGVSS